MDARRCRAIRRRFVGRRLGLGLPEIGPSKLTSRSELRERGIRCFYFGNPGDHHTIDAAPGPLLLWSRFPDQRYTDSTAVDETLYDALWDGLELAWQRTVQAVPLDRPVLVTSDHGYVFLGAGLSDPSLKGVDRPLEGKRFRTFGSHEALPASHPGLWGGSENAGSPMLAGRCHNRPQAPSASRSVYRHGGLTLMEMLTPWLVLEPATCTAGDGARGAKSKDVARRRGGAAMLTRLTVRNFKRFERAEIDLGSPVVFIGPQQLRQDVGAAGPRPVADRPSALERESARARRLRRDGPG